MSMREKVTEAIRVGYGMREPLCVLADEIERVEAKVDNLVYLKWINDNAPEVRYSTATLEEKVEEKIDVECRKKCATCRVNNSVPTEYRYTEGYIRQLQKQVEDQKVQLDYLREALHTSDIKYVSLKNRVNNLAVEK